MENKEISLEIFFNKKLKDRNESFDFIVNQLTKDNTQKKKLLNEFLSREDVGSIEIAKHVILPHFESKLIQQSSILILKLENDIESWNHDINQVKLIIVIALKEPETIENKKIISSFIRKFADDLFIEKLLQETDEEKFKKIIELN